MTLKTFTPAEYLMIDIANSFGLDKKLWSERLQWFRDNVVELENLACMTSGHASHPLIQQADQPAQFFAGLKALAQTQRGEPTGYLIHLDATASGAQILSLLVDCAKSGSNCNLVDTGKRENLYANLYDAIGNLLGQDLDVSAQDAKKAVNH